MQSRKHQRTADFKRGLTAALIAVSGFLTLACGAQQGATTEEAARSAAARQSITFSPPTAAAGARRRAGRRIGTTGRQASRS